MIKENLILQSGRTIHSKIDDDITIKAVWSPTTLHSDNVQITISTPVDNLFNNAVKFNIPAKVKETHAFLTKEVSNNYLHAILTHLKKEDSEKFSSAELYELRDGFKNLSKQVEDILHSLKQKEEEISSLTQKINEIPLNAKEIPKRDWPLFILSQITALMQACALSDEAKGKVLMFFLSGLVSQQSPLLSSYLPRLISA